MQRRSRPGPVVSDAEVNDDGRPAYHWRFANRRYPISIFPLGNVDCALTHRGFKYPGGWFNPKEGKDKMEIDPRDELKEEFERNGEWRREKGAAYSNDSRNKEAAAIFDKLAETTKDIDLRVLTAYRELLEDLSDTKTHAEAMRSVGFHSWPETAEEFCRNFIADRTASRY